MTARKFVSWALEDTYEDYTLQKALQRLAQYMGKNSDFYLQFPDVEVLDADGKPLEENLEEPANFQEYWEGRN
jgi:hypothetical protein